MFENISQRFRDITRRLFSPAHLTEKNMDQGLQEIRTALLEADVNYKVVQDFMVKIKEQAVGEAVLKSVTPAQQIVKIVSDELVRLMGPEDSSIQHSEAGPTVIMMVGLQGSGKTTTCGKLALYLQQKYGSKPLLVAADIQRPAAVEQLQILGDSISVPVYQNIKGTPPQICQESIPYAQKKGCDVVILDTAGRLHIDDDLMKELESIRSKVRPHNIFFVCDAMTGQDAVNSAQAFNNRLEISGVILTKLDGDARGGAALSIKAITGKVIKFIGVGEKLDRLEEFHPDRMASRILGMGDVVSLVEKAQEFIDEEKAREMQEKLLGATFTLEDFIEQFRMIRKMGSLQDLVGMLPGQFGAQFQDIANHEQEIAQVEAIIYSMTPEERQDSDMISGSRRTRIARGSGTDIQSVNQLIKQFREARNALRNLGKMSGMLSRFMGGGGGGGLHKSVKTKIRRK